MHLQNFIKIHHLVHKILSTKETSTSIKGHNSFEMNEKYCSIIQIYILSISNYNAYTKFDRNPQAIENKQNSDVDQGP